MTDYCSSRLYEDYDGAEEPCINCVRAKGKKHTEYFPKRPTNPITNGVLIRSMTDEELAAWLAKQKYRRPTFDDWFLLCYEVMGPRICHEDGCEKCWLDWLKSPVGVSEWALLYGA